MQRQVLFSIVIIIVVVTMSGCSQQGVQQYKGSVSRIHSISTSSERGEGAPAPDFSWFDEAGNKVSFKDIARGKPVLINFWATWCMPCKRELPDLRAINKEYKDEGALVIGVSVDKVENEYLVDFVRKFAKEWDLGYQILIDENHELWEAFGIAKGAGIPTTILVNREGRIAKSFVGSRKKEQFAAEFDKLLR